jgi:uncharacterized small protein (DUF1192 family)
VALNPKFARNIAQAIANFGFATLDAGYAKIGAKSKGGPSMAIDLDELAPKKPKADIVLGEDLSHLSAHELEARIALLEGEILRAKDALRARSTTKSAADAFFKR